jgi:hypothetical protein
LGLELVARMPSLMEAQIAAGALRSGGVDAEVFDANFGQMEAPVIESLGGFRIMAPADQASVARELLRALRASPGLSAAEEGGPWAAGRRAVGPGLGRSARRIWSVIFVVSALLWIAGALVQRS